MKQTLHAILTDPVAREDLVIIESLQHEFSAGAPWFNE